MTFHSFSVYVHLHLICFAFTILLQVLHAAGAPLNATIRLDSPLVSFTPGWRVATFGGTGQQFAFTNGQNEELLVTLPQNTTAVFYQGFKVAGGSLYFACIDCSSTTAQGPNTIAVDAHDDTENGTQPPETLFSFTDLDPTATHILTVVNLEDDRFSHTSQITFDSLVVTVGTDAPGSTPSTTTTTSATSTGGIGGIPTITVTAGHGPKQSASSISTSASQTDTVGGTVASTTTASPSSDSQSAGSQITGAGTATSGSGASVTGTATGTQPPNTSQATQTQGTGATGTLGSSGTSGSSPTSATDSNGGKGISGAGSQPTSNTSSAANGRGTSGSSNNGAAPSGGVSKTVIIVVAIVASLVVLSLLGVIVWLLLRSQPPPTDPEGASGLMREAPTTAIISGPIALAPMRPPNPFADTVPADIPIDEVSPVDETFAPPFRPPPPPIPPKSPLRAAFTRPRVPAPAWIDRVPRTP